MPGAERHASGAGHTVQTHAGPQAYAVARRLQAFVRPRTATRPGPVPTHALGAEGGRRWTGRGAGGPGGAVWDGPGRARGMTPPVSWGFVFRPQGLTPRFRRRR